MSEKKDYRVEAEVKGTISIFLEAENEAEAIDIAKTAIEGGEANINWGEEGNGMVSFTLPRRESIEAFEE